MDDKDEWGERVREICASWVTWWYIYIYIYILWTPPHGSTSVEGPRTYPQHEHAMTCEEWWMIGTKGERESGKYVLAEWLDDTYIYIYIYILWTPPHGSTSVEGPRTYPQHEHARTCEEWWMIGTNGEREPGKYVLAEWLDDIYIYIYIYLRCLRKVDMFLHFEMAAIFFWSDNLYFLFSGAIWRGFSISYLFLQTNRN